MKKIDGGCVCPKCEMNQVFVIDSRPIHKTKFQSKIFNTIRRRRECGSCGYRYTTYEVPVEIFNFLDAVKKAMVSEKKLMCARKEFEKHLDFS